MRFSILLLALLLVPPALARKPIRGSNPARR